MTTCIVYNFSIELVCYCTAFWIEEALGVRWGVGFQSVAQGFHKVDGLLSTPKLVMGFGFGSWPAPPLNTWELAWLVFCGRDFCSLTGLSHLPWVVLKLPPPGLFEWLWFQSSCWLKWEGGGENNTKPKHWKTKPNVVITSSACLVDLGNNDLQNLIMFSVFHSSYNPESFFFNFYFWHCEYLAISILWLGKGYGSSPVPCTAATNVDWNYKNLYFLAHLGFIVI